MGISGGLPWTSRPWRRRPLARLYRQPPNSIACRLQAPPERLLAGSIARRWYRQHLLLRIAVARAPEPAPPRQYLESARGAPLAQSNCVRSLACLRMLSASGAQLSRPGVVVSGSGENSSCVWPRRKTLPPLWRANSAHRSGWPFHILLRAVPKVSATN